MPPLSFIVDRRESGQTLAAVLRARFGLSWSKAKRLVEGKHVRVSGQVESDVARRLRAGKRVELAAGTIKRQPDLRRDEGVKERKGETKTAPSDLKPKPAPPKRPGKGARVTPSPPHPFSPSIVYCDDALVVVNKPAGLTTMRHKEEAAEFGEHGQRFLPRTLGDLLPGLIAEPGRLFIGVHRIDRDTSGLVVFARTRRTAEQLGIQFRKHMVDRRYRALTRGVPNAGRLESVLVRDRGDGRRGSSTTPDPPGGKRAVTHVAVVERMGNFALVECRLETGRTHQVRIHLGEAGTPLCGEKVYDRPLNGKPTPDVTGAKRPMLHAARLGFVHPESGESLSWEVPPPADFAALLQQLRG